MLEKITVAEQKGAYDTLIEKEMEYEQAQRIIFINLLWSTLMFLIGMLI